MDTIIGLALLLALAMATYAATRKGVASKPLWRQLNTAERRTFPAVMARQTHWSRATGIVELSLSRAADMASQHANAARQLEAADYALHVLLGELSQVMATTVRSPLEQTSRVLPANLQIPSALAA